MMKQIAFNRQGKEAILAGLKWITRRPMKPQPEYRENESIAGHFGTFFHGWNLDHELVGFDDIAKYCPYKTGETVELVGFDDWGHVQVPYVFATALIKELWQEQLQDISEEAAIAEGAPNTRVCMPGGRSAGPIEYFVHSIWQPIYKGTEHDWNNNEWQWVIVLEVNSDQNDEWEIEIR